MINRIFCRPFKVRIVIHQHEWRAGMYYSKGDKYKNTHGAVVKCNKCGAYKAYHVNGRHFWLNLLLFFANDKQAVKLIHKLNCDNNSYKDHQIGFIDWQ